MHAKCEGREMVICTSISNLCSATTIILMENYGMVDATTSKKPLLAVITLLASVSHILDIALFTGRRPTFGT